MSKPRLTKRVLRGIIAGLAVHEAGEPSDMLGSNSPENTAIYNDAMFALRWAREMLVHKGIKHDEE